MDLIAAHLDALQSHLPGGIGIPLPTKDLLFPTARHLHTTHALLVDTLGLPVELWTPLLMVVPALVLDGLRRLPPRPRATGAVLGIFALLLFPLHVTTESIAGDYGSANVCVCVCHCCCCLCPCSSLFCCLCRRCPCTTVAVPVTVCVYAMHSMPRCRDVLFISMH